MDFQGLKDPRFLGLSGGRQNVDEPPDIPRKDLCARAPTGGQEFVPKSVGRGVEPASEKLHPGDGSGRLRVVEAHPETLGASPAEN